MSEPVVRVTAEIRDLGDRWEAYAYGGPVTNPVDLRIEAPTEDEAKAEFVPAWNAAAGTDWAPAEFQFVRNEA